MGGVVASDGLSKRTVWWLVGGGLLFFILPAILNSLVSGGSYGLWMFLEVAVVIAFLFSLKDIEKALAGRQARRRIREAGRAAGKAKSVASRPEPIATGPSAASAGELKRSGGLTLGLSLTIDPHVLGHCYVERIAKDPHGGGDIAFVRAEKAALPMQYESEPGDPTLYQFRVSGIDPTRKRS
jgi:hypothetical protein